MSTTIETTCNATLVLRRDLTPELAIVRVAPDTGTLPAFEPGQFCMLGLPPSAEDAAARPVLSGKAPRVRLVRRAYSIASAPRVREYLELLIVLVQQGRLTPRIWTVSEGGRLYLDPKIAGEFTLARVPRDRTLVLVATGTGLAPFMSMLRQYAGTADRRWNRCVVMHGVRTAADLAYQEELREIAQHDPSVTYLPICSREPADSGWVGARGHVQDWLAPERFAQATGAELDPARAEVMLCGNPRMIQDVVALLQPRGFVEARRDQPGNLHYERYW